MMRIKTAVKKLSARFPKITGIKPAVEWGGERYKNAIFLGDCAEGGTIDGRSACSYYNEDYKETTYIMGVHKDLRAYLAELGFWAECNDPGTYIAWRE